MNESANITYSQVADRTARVAFEQVAAEITALKRAAAKAAKADSGYGAATVSGVSAAVSAYDMRETPDGLMILTFAFSVTPGGSDTYATFLSVDKGFPKLAVAAAVSYLSAPPAAANVTCAVLADGSVKVGTTGTNAALDCVATAIWRRR